MNFINWLFNLNKEERVKIPYVNPFNAGDKVVLVRNLYNYTGSSWMPRPKEDIENFDVFHIFIDSGSKGIVSHTFLDYAVVKFDDIPFKAIVIVNNLKKEQI